MESESGSVGVGLGLLRILGVGVGIFDPTPTLKVQFNYFSTCFACLFLPVAQASSSWAFLTMKLWEGVANAFKLFFSEFSLLCQKVDFFTL